MPNARTLRKSMTDAERRLWSLLRDRQLGGYKFRRQHPLGSYVLDFACVDQQLAVEVDGGQHAVDVAKDEARTAYLEVRGYRVIRFWNNDVLERIEGVVSEIERTLETCPPPTPPINGRGD